MTSENLARSMWSFKKDIDNYALFQGFIHKYFKQCQDEDSNV